MSEKSLRVAVVQAAPVIMDRDATLDKVHALSRSARDDGARLILLPEAFVPGYPRGLTFGTSVGTRNQAGRMDFQRYADNAIVIGSPAEARLREMARELHVYLVVGVIEKDTEFGAGTLYCTLLYYGPDGTLLGIHRKLKPTASERLIWGEGDGSTLTAVDTPYGRIGGLICWENYMPLARTAMYGKGLSLYLAPTADSRDGWQSTLRHIALESRCFVLGCNQFVTKSMYPRDLASYDELSSQPEVMCRGGSAIVGPLGDYVAGPLFGEEGTLIADLDLDLLSQARYDFDVCGHYARPDVFQLSVDESKKNGIKYMKP